MIYYYYYTYYYTGIVVDTAEDDVAETLKILIDVYNNNNEVGNKIIINASWDIASLDNNCELIRSSKHLN